MPVSVIFDGNNNIYRFFHTQPAKSVDGQRVESAIGLFNCVNNITKEMADIYGCQVNPIVVQDSDGKNFRHEIFPAYKAERSGMPEELKCQEPLASKLLEYSGIPVISQNGLEADDIIATLAKTYEDSGHDVVIITTDKDLMQLVNDNIKVYNPVSKKFFGTEEVKEKLGVYPCNVAMTLAITGDRIDGIIGIPGVGEKKAADLINEYNSIEGILEAQGSIKGVMGENIRAHGDVLSLNLRLTTLVSDIDLLSPPNLLKVWGVPSQIENLDKLKVSIGIKKEAAGRKPLFEKETVEPKESSKKVDKIDFFDDQLALF